MDERLISRFSWGLTVAIEPPGWKNACGDPAAQSAEAENIKLDNVAFFIAQTMHSQCARLEGALKRVVASCPLFTNRVIAGTGGWR